MCQSIAGVLREDLQGSMYAIEIDMNILDSTNNSWSYQFRARTMRASCDNLFFTPENALMSTAHRESTVVHAVSCIPRGPKLLRLRVAMRHSYTVPKNQSRRTGQ